jgi:hypothetical protein
MKILLAVDGSKYSDAAVQALASKNSRLDHLENEHVGIFLANRCSKRADAEI